MRFLNFFICFTLLFFGNLSGNATSEVFAKYPNKYFIESGSFTGNGILNAMEAGFEKIYSIELSPYYYQLCRDQFAQFPNVVLFEGDSGKVLPTILEQIDAPATFWLDGHYSNFVNTAKGDTLCPILAELESIRNHSIKTHTILIDDVRLFGTVHFDYVTIKEVIKKIKAINPNYIITYEMGAFPNDVLVAYINK